MDIRNWYRQKLIVPNQSFITKWSHNNETISSVRVDTEKQRIKLTYRHRNSNNEWADFSYFIYLSWTSCHYGKKRPWFLCPANNCGKRVAVLYGGKIFACRYCYQLTYACQQESFPYRMSRRAEKIRVKLGWGPGFLEGDDLRPKGMHHRTYKRLSAQHDVFSAQAIAWFESRLRLIGESIEDWT